MQERSEANRPSSVFPGGSSESSPCPLVKWGMQIQLDFEDPNKGEDLQVAVGILKSIYKFFDTPSFKKWSLILFPLRVGLT